MKDLIQIAARVPADVAEEFQRVCREDDRTVSNELRRMIRRRIAEDERSARPAKSDASEERTSRPSAHVSG